MPAYCHTSVHCASPGESAVEVSVTPSWVEVEQVWFQVACPKGVAETSSAVEHVGCAVNLTGKGVPRQDKTPSRTAHIENALHVKTTVALTSCSSIFRFYLCTSKVNMMEAYTSALHNTAS